jgi:hypothetical protein
MGRALGRVPETVGFRPAKTVARNELDHGETAIGTGVKPGHFGRIKQRRQIRHTLGWLPAGAGVHLDLEGIEIEPEGGHRLGQHGVERPGQRQDQVKRDRQHEDQLKHPVLVDKGKGPGRCHGHGALSHGVPRW